MGKTNAEMCRNYYYRKKAAKEAEKIRQGLLLNKPLTKTGAERTRACRLRKKMLSQVNESSVTEIVSIPSTSNSRTKNYNFLQSEREGTETEFWDEDDKVSNQSNDGNIESENSSIINRTLNFPPQECSLLLRCVKSEQQHVSSKESTESAVTMENNAWAVNIKTEPVFEHTVDKESSSDVSDNEQATNEEYNDVPVIEMEHSDPLSAIPNGDSRIDSMNNFGCLNQTQDKEIGKLKLELLKYQLETAKIERQRIQERTKSERSERETKAIEMSLRLRAARLELIAAEAKLPAAHPALQQYHYTETKARAYIQQFSNT